MRTKSRKLLKNLNTKKIINDLNYDLGLMVGELIVNNHLPTLNTDMVNTNQIINVSDEETKKWVEISEKNFKRWLDNGMKNKDEEYLKEFYENLKWYHLLEEKYLPETINVRINKIKPTNLKDFKKGINDALWDCDFSHYTVNDDFFDIGHEAGWCSIITLTRHIEKIPEKYLDI